MPGPCCWKLNPRWCWTVAGLLRHQIAHNCFDSKRTRPAARMSKKNACSASLPVPPCKPLANESSTTSTATLYSFYIILQVRTLVKTRSGKRLDKNYLYPGFSGLKHLSVGRVKRLQALYPSGHRGAGLTRPWRRSPSPPWPTSQSPRAGKRPALPAWTLRAPDRCRSASWQVQAPSRCG